LLTRSYDYELPPGLIAQHPPETRGESRLLVLDRSGGTIRDTVFRELPGFVEPGDVVVVNDSRVFPARLVGRKPTGARAEVLLLRQSADDPFCWRAMIRPGGKLKPGTEVRVASDLTVRILNSDREGGRMVRLECADGAEDPWAVVERRGRVPLPPYIARPADSEDSDRYQTVYARDRGSVAAPTAGLHFTENALQDVRARGAHVESVTLHVGPGTFRPVTASRAEDHSVGAERWTLPAGTAERLNEAIRMGRRIWAVGTTACRVLETAARGAAPVFEAGAGETGLFIRPPYEFRVVGGLLTNFHLPTSSLIMLVSAFAGREFVLGAYAHAVRQRYRFYSYGDAMLIL